MRHVRPRIPLAQLASAQTESAPARIEDKVINFAMAEADAVDFAMDFADADEMFGLEGSKSNQLCLDARVTLQGKCLTWL